jgi:hypothetical protein
MDPDDDDEEEDQHLPIPPSQQNDRSTSSIFISFVECRISSFIRI